MVDIYFIMRYTNGMSTASYEKGNGRSAAVSVAYIAIGVALIVVCSWISVPLVVPFTLQTFAVFFIICVLGEKKATFAIFAYCLTGLIGVPVFASFGAGPAVLFGRTGGYIIGFIFMPLASYLVGKLLGKSAVAKALGLLAGLILLYVFGTVWYMIIYTRSIGEIGLGVALMNCVVPFILPDIAKLALAVVVGSRVKKIIKI